MTSAYINPALLNWSRQRAGLTHKDLAKGMAAKPEQVTAWEAGEGLPSFRQAQKWALATHIPFGFLFLPVPPQELLALPDLRTVGSTAPLAVSVNLRDTVRNVLHKQAWYLEYLKEQEVRPLPFVGRFTAGAPLAEVVADMRKRLALQGDARDHGGDVYFRHLIHAAEALGILVMRSGIVGSNTRRTLDVGEFRGFAISDTLAPVIFINSTDAPTARLFTLVHEMAHLWIGSSGISDFSPGSTRQEEVFCNAVAGEFLMPQAQFLPLWRPVEEWRLNLAPLAATFHVSQLAIARRALDLGCISRDDYAQYYRDELSRYRGRVKEKGGSFYRSAGAKNSIRFSRAVLAEAKSGRLLLRDAGRLLGMQLAKLAIYAETLGV